MYPDFSYLVYVQSAPNESLQVRESQVLKYSGGLEEK